MSASTSIPAYGIPREPALPHMPAWPGALNRLRRSPVRRTGRATSGCFGALTDKDKMVVKGLAASLASPAEDRTVVKRPAAGPESPAERGEHRW